MSADVFFLVRIEIATDLSTSSAKELCIDVARNLTDPFESLYQGGNFSPFKLGDNPDRDGLQTTLRRRRGAVSANGCHSRLLSSVVRLTREELGYLVS